jgi:adenylate cyclase
MDRIWQWAWDRYGTRLTRYRLALLAAFLPVTLSVYLPVTLSIAAFEKSGHYLEAAIVTAGAVLVLVYLMVSLGSREMRLVEQWASGHEVDRATALEGTYSLARRSSSVMVRSTGVWAAVLSVAVGAIAGAPGLRLVQYAILGAVYATGVMLIAYHNIVEAVVRPVRVTLAGDTGIGDALPRSRPSFAARSNVSVVAVAFTLPLAGAMLAAVSNRASEIPVLAVAIGGALAIGLALPISVGMGFSPSLQPIRDLAHGAERVVAGDFSRRLPVVQDDDLGVLAASFNRMQAGLAERQRLQAAFGTYVDPALAARLLEQGDDVFTGERREVTVMFVDVRDFTPFAEANSAEDTVARLNALFEIVVPAVVDAGSHVNKFLGDGALAVFGAPTSWPIMPTLLCWPR